MALRTCATLAAVRAATRRCQPAVAAGRALSSTPSARSSSPRGGAASALNVDTTARAAGPNAASEEGATLGEIVRKAIDATGPMSLARYMTLCLSHSTQGYCTSRGDVFGKEGDFITSPEISQVFGELIALWLLTRWQANGSPAKVRLLELGPGRGTLMADILSTFESFPEIMQGIESIDLVETSEVMKALQHKALAGQVNVRWHNSVDQVPPSDAFTFFVAHEFFDALPIHILQRVAPSSSSSAPEFRELLLTHTPPSSTLHLTLSPGPTPQAQLLPQTAPAFAEVKEGERVEVSPAAFGTMQALGRLLSEGGGGSGLVVDYGKDGWASESFRAFKDHAAVSPFDNVGTADLTANVDFSYLRHALATLPSSSPSASSSSSASADKPTALGPLTQADFLEAMGLSIRLSELLKRVPAAERTRAAELEAACERLVDRNAMGGEYLFLGVESARKGTPAAEGGSGKVYPF